MDAPRCGPPFKLRGLPREGYFCFCSMKAAATGCEVAAMGSYGQFCAIAKALEVVGERRTPLILRELMCGSSRFSEIHRGIPRISPALLSKRLSDLEHSGVIVHDSATGVYALTDAGWEIKPVIEQLGVWGQRWVRGQLSKDDFDPDLVMWDMRRRIDLRKLPTTRTCLSFEFSDRPKRKRHYWIVCNRDGLDLCLTNWRRRGGASRLICRVELRSIYLRVSYRAQFCGLRHVH